MTRQAGTKNSAPVAVDSIVFEDVEVPQIKRATTAVNPFMAEVEPRAVAFLADPSAKQTGRAFQVPNSKVEQTLRLLGLAGRAHGVTIRKTTVANGDTTRITYWCAPLQSRPRKK